MARSTTGEAIDLREEAIMRKDVKIRKCHIPSMVFLIACAASTSATAETTSFVPDVSKLPISGSWISSIEDRRKCTGSLAESTVDSTADFVLTLKTGTIQLTGREYSATYRIQRVRESETGGSVLELSGLAQGRDEVARIRSLWFLKSNARNEDVLIVVEWTESVQVGGQEGNEQIFDPIPFAGTYIRCFN